MGKIPRNKELLSDERRPLDFPLADVQNSRINFCFRHNADSERFTTSV